MYFVFETSSFLSNISSIENSPSSFSFPGNLIIIQEGLK